jgi:precorrin-6B methylase 2
MSQSLIIELAQRIAANAAKIDEHYRSHGLVPPSFGLDALATDPVLPQDLEAARQAAIHDCDDLKLLLQGPNRRFHDYAGAEIVSQHAIVRFGFAQAFPVGSEATFEQIANTTGMNERDVAKVIRHGVTQRIFSEPRAGVVTHTAASRVLAQDAQIANWVQFNTGEICPALLRTPDAMKEYPGSMDTAKTGFALANDTDKPLFGFLAQHPDRQKRFGQAMRFFATRPGLEPEHVVEGYSWNKLPDGATVVDVGGSHGLISIELARRFPQLRYIVEDLDVRDSLAQLPQEVADRVRFQAHNFLMEKQPVEGADVYFFRAVFHNFPDEKAVGILHGLVPALKPGAKIVVNDVLVPRVGEQSDRELANLRAGDLVMSALFNASDRDINAWERLFKAADSRFKFLGGRRPEGSKLGIIEAEWI